MLAREAGPENVAIRARRLATHCAIRRRQPQVGEQERQQEEIRDDDHAHAEAGELRASSRMIPILITSIVMKPTVSVSSATRPGAIELHEGARARLSGRRAPLNISLRNVEIFWTPCAHADRKDEKRHQHGNRIEAVA